MTITQSDLHNAAMFIVNLDAPINHLQQKISDVRLQPHHNTCIWLASASEDLSKVKNSLSLLSQQLENKGDVQHIVENDAFSFETLTKLSSAYHVTQVEHVGFE